MYSLTESRNPYFSFIKHRQVHLHTLTQQKKAKTFGLLNKILAQLSYRTLSADEIEFTWIFLSFFFFCKLCKTNTSLVKNGCNNIIPKRQSCYVKETELPHVSTTQNLTNNCFRNSINHLHSQNFFCNTSNKHSNNNIGISCFHTWILHSHWTINREMYFYRFVNCAPELLNLPFHFSYAFICLFVFSLTQIDSFIISFYFLSLSLLPGFCCYCS